MYSICKPCLVSPNISLCHKSDRVGGKKLVIFFDTLHVQATSLTKAMFLRASALLKRKERTADLPKYQINAKFLFCLPFLLINTEVHPYQLRLSLNPESSLEDVRIRKSWPQNHCAEPDKLLSCISSPCIQAQLLPANLNFQEQSGNKQTGWAENLPLRHCKIMLLIKEVMKLGLFSFPVKKILKFNFSKLNFRNSTFQHFHPSIFSVHLVVAQPFENLLFQGRQDHHPLSWEWLIALTAEWEGQDWSSSESEGRSTETTRCPSDC